MSKTEMTKQLQLHELTMYQQIALESEVESIIDGCVNDIDKAYYTFMKLALVDEKYLLAYKQEFMKYVDESVVNDCINYRYMEIIPVYLYAAKYMQDIKSMLGEDCGSLKIFKQPKSVIKSKYVVFMRELLTYIPVTAKAIMDSIMREDDGELDFLSPVTLVLKESSSIEADVIEQRVGFDVKIKLLSTPITKVPILNIQAEDERMKRMNTIESLGGEEKIKTILDGLVNMVKNSLEVNSTSMAEPIEEIEEEPAEKLIHVVKKIDKSNGQVVFTKEFDTQKQATDYIKKVVEDYPEIIKRFNFIVELTEV